MVSVSKSSGSGGSIVKDANGGGRFVFGGNRYVVAVGVGFFVFLLASAAVLGWGAYSLLKDAEKDLGDTRFEFVSVHALTSAQEKLNKQIGASRTNAAMIGNFFPDLEEWPFVSVPGFDQILEELQATAGGRDGGFSPLVKPEDALAWEEFAYEYIEKWYPPGFGVSEFGKGVFAFDSSLNNTDKRFHDISGNNSCGSPYVFLNPNFHYSSPGSGGFRDVLMINVYSVCYAARGLDAMLDHGKSRLQAFLNNETVPQPLGFMQAFSWPPFDFPPELGPATTYNMAIYPRNAPFNMTGNTGVQIRWIDVLSNVFPKDVNGMYCVIERNVGGSYIDAHTFEIVNGAPTFVGPGNLPAVKWREQRSLDLVAEEDILPGSSEYKLFLYSTGRFYEAYQTTNPKIATIGVIGVIIFTAAVFLLYDKLLRKQVRHREAVLAAQRQFMRFVSHEVRTPLNTVCMGLKLLQEEVDALVEKTQPTSTRTSFVAKEISADVLAQEISSMADEAVSILDDLLNFDKIQHGELSLELTVLPVWSLIEAIFNEFRLPSKAKNIALTLELQGDTDDSTVFVENASAVPDELLRLKAVGDRIRLAQVLRNCMSNAMKFTPEKGRVTVNARFIPRDLLNQHARKELGDEREQENLYDRKGAVVVDVVDTGPGMTRDQLGKLFGVGVQFNVNELQAGRGSGLGLHIAQGLAEAHHGTLEATSEGLGKGSTFTLTLPTFYVPDSVLPGHLGKRPGAGDETSTNVYDEMKNQQTEEVAINVLVVDDSALNRKMLVGLLKKRGYICHQAHDGRHALDVYGQLVENGVHVDSILMDYEMPHMNGPLSCKALREMNCNSFIAGVTGNVLQDDVDYFKSCGADFVLAKPLKIDMMEGLWRDNGVIS